MYIGNAMTQIKPIEKEIKNFLAMTDSASCVVADRMPIGQAGRLRVKQSYKNRKRRAYMSKIISLRAENIKRLKAVEITPDGNTVIITGRNEQGKSSVLDSIWFCLGGKDSLKDTPTPIRAGEEEAVVRIETDDLIVERSWTANDKTYLKVMSKDGASYPSPQAMLDKLVGNLSFDPLEFSKQEQNEQVATLLQLIDLKIDLNEIAAKKKQLYDERTQVNREFKTLQATHSQLPEPENNLPDKEIPIGSATAQLTEATNVIRENDKKRGLLRQVETESKELIRKVDDAKEKIAQLVKLQAQLELERDEVIKRLRKGEVVVKSLIDPDLIDIQAKIEETEVINTKIRQRDAYANIHNQMDEKKLESDKLTGEIEALETSKVDAIATAKFPIDKLGFDDTGVIYKGIPFSQCSSAERLRVSLAIAMALNPKLRVIRIMDGSLLDKDNLKLVAEMAKEKDFQIWVETISNENTDPLAVYIEDGTVVATPEKPKRKKKDA